MVPLRVLVPGGNGRLAAVPRRVFAAPRVHRACADWSGILWSWDNIPSWTFICLSSPRLVVSTRYIGPLVDYKTLPPLWHLAALARMFSGFDSLDILYIVADIYRKFWVTDIDTNMQRKRDRETERQRDRETKIQRDRETERQRDRETERRRDRDKEIERETEIHCMYMYIVGGKDMIQHYCSCSVYIIIVYTVHHVYCSFSRISATVWSHLRLVFRGPGIDGKVFRLHRDRPPQPFSSLGWGTLIGWNQTKWSIYKDFIKWGVVH